MRCIPTSYKANMDHLLSITKEVQATNSVFTVTMVLDIYLPLFPVDIMTSFAMSDTMEHLENVDTEHQMGVKRNKSYLQFRLGRKIDAQVVGCNKVLGLGLGF